MRRIIVRAATCEILPQVGEQGVVAGEKGNVMHEAETDADAERYTPIQQDTQEARRLEKEGFAVIEGVLTAEEVSRLIASLAALFTDAEDAGGRGVYGVRGLLEAAPAARELAACGAVRRLVEPILGTDCLAVRGILFDKIAGANWKVPWHQDLTVGLRERQDAEGFGPWSEKAGIVHAQAPPALLEQMIAVRLHLDDCGETNGPLRVLPGTHRAGRLNAERIQTLRAELAPVSCVVAQGGAVLMRPLLLHASSPAQSPRHRRVIHLEYAKADALPCPLHWHTQVG